MLLSPPLQWKFKSLLGKVYLREQGKTLLGDVNKLLFPKVCWQGPAMFCLYKQIFLPIIWIFTENKGDGIESRLPFKNIFYFMRKWESNSKLIKTLSVPSFDMAFQERIWPLKSLASCDWCSILIIIIECAAQVEIGCTRYV